MAIHTEKTEPGRSSSRKMNGWLALSPLFVFLAVYLAGSLVAHDFYKVPVAAAFIVASAYSLLITRGVKTTDEKISIFSEGAGNKNVLMMIWIFVLAGAFASTAKDIGAIDATVNATLHILPGKLIADIAQIIPIRTALLAAQKSCCRIAHVLHGFIAMSHKFLIHLSKIFLCNINLTADGITAPIDARTFIFTDKVRQDFANPPA